MKKIIPLIIWSAVMGALLCCFYLISGLWHYLFSLGAIFVGLRFFGECKGWGIRASFIILSIVLFLLFTTLYISFAPEYGWPLPQTSESE